MIGSLIELRRILQVVKYKDWWWRTGRLGDGFYIQLQFRAPDSVKRCRPVVQRGGKFYVSKHTANNELIRTCYAAVKSAVFHEMDEEFKVHGFCIYHPHISTQALEAAARLKKEYRK